VPRRWPPGNRTSLDAFARPPREPLGRVTGGDVSVGLLECLELVAETFVLTQARLNPCLLGAGQFAEAVLLEQQGRHLEQGF
jgi:hypothetical protein